MNIDMSIIERAYELGRAAERQKMADLAAIASSQSLTNITQAVTPGPPKLHTIQDKSIKPPAAAPAAKKALGPRTKGVKEAILALLSSNPMSAGDIISVTGFKGTSVRATLMSLKKSGLAMNIDGHWVAVHHDGQGNSENVEPFNVLSDGLSAR